MHRSARLLWSLALVLASFPFALTAQSYSGGAPSTAAEEGCTCHGAQDPTVLLDVQFPERYERGVQYTATLTIRGGPMPIPGVSMNQGGLAVSSSAGSFAAAPGLSTEGPFLTHTSQGNDQRSWSFAWVAPDSGNATVTLWFAGNAVNGDGRSDGGLDRWNKGMRSIPASANETSIAPTETPESTESPAPGWGIAFVFPVVAVVWLRWALEQR